MGLLVGVRWMVGLAGQDCCLSAEFEDQLVGLPHLSALAPQICYNQSPSLLQFYPLATNTQLPSDHPPVYAILPGNHSDCVVNHVLVTLSPMEVLRVQ